MRGDSSAGDYRKRLYDSYVTTHMKTLGDVNETGLRQAAQAYDSCFRAFLPADQGAAIAEVGCGYGRFLHWLRELGYRNTCGVDSSPEMVAHAARLGIAGVKQGDVVKFLEEHPGAFERIFAIDVMEHFKKEEVLPFLDACLSALKAGGMLVIETVNAEGFGWGRLRHGDFTHEYAYTPNSLSQLLLASGFSSPSFCPVRPFGAGWRALLRRLSWRIVEQLGRVYLHAGTSSGLINSGHILTDNLIASARRPAL